MAMCIFFERTTTNHVPRQILKGRRCVGHTGIGHIARLDARAAHLSGHKAFNFLPPILVVFVGLV